MAPENKKIYSVELPLSLFLTVIGALAVVIGSGLIYIARGHIAADESLRAELYEFRDKEFEQYKVTAQENFNSIEVAINVLGSNQEVIIAHDEHCKEQQIKVQGKLSGHGERIRDMEYKFGITDTNLKECLRRLQ